MPTSFDPDSVIAGGERYAFELARALAAHVPTTLFTFGRVPKSVQIGPLEIRHCRALGYAGGIINPISVAHLPGLGRCDVVHCLQPRTIVTDLAMLWGAALRKRTFLTDLAGGAGIRPSRYIPMANLMTGFLPISEYNKSLNPWITRPTTVISSGVDTVTFAPDPAAARHQRRVVYVGRIFDGKGLHLLLEALPDDVALDIVGSGSGPYMERVTQLAVGKSVVFHGALPDEAVVQVYQRAALIALPSLVDSGVTSSLEAMACATPVVGARLGTLTEIVTEETGWLVPPGDVPALRAALVDALSDQGRLRAKGEAARAHVLRNFTWPEVAARCVKAYGQA
jgi:glycosyltransferase involved in cell wall biosynthesis